MKITIPTLLLSLFLPNSLYAQAHNTRSATNPFEVDFDAIVMGDFLYLDGLYLSDNDEQHLNIRKAAAELSIIYDKKYTLEFGVDYDDTNNEFRVRDANINIDFPNRFDLKIGKMKQVFGLGKATSLKNLSSLERQLSNDILDIDRSTGVLLEKSYKENFLQLSYYKQKHQDGHYLSSMLGRYVYKTEHSQFGISYAQQDFDESNYRISSDTGLDILDGFLKTEKVKADKVETWGLDGLWQAGRFSILGEFVKNKVTSSQEGERQYLGAYLQTSWFLTEHHLRFNKGKVQRVKTQGHHAIELVSTLGFLDAMSAGDGFEVYNIGLGVNFYINKQFKIMSEFSFINVTGGDYSGQQGRSFKVRAQYRF